MLKYMAPKHICTNDKNGEGFSAPPISIKKTKKLIMSKTRATADKSKWILAPLEKSSIYSVTVLRTSSVMLDEIC